MKIVLNDGRKLSAYLSITHPQSCFGIPILVGADGVAHSRYEVREVYPANDEEREDLAMGGYFSERFSTQLMMS